jgi:hypothetical protein
VEKFHFHSFSSIIFGNAKWFIDYFSSAIGNYDILGRLVTAVCLGVLDFPDNILGQAEKS